jgi:outer membrane biosynthesis protein TonB
MIRTFAIAATLVVASQAGAVPRNTVKAHIDKATKAHKEGKFDVALDELKAAYALDPKPDLLFAIAQVYVKLDKCADAITYYERFLAATKDAQAKQVVAQAIETCKTKLAATAPPVAVVEPPPPVEPEPPKLDPEPAPATPSPSPTPAPTPTPFAEVRSTPTKRSAWYLDPVGDALVAGGVAAGVVALVVRGAAQREADEAATASSETAYRDRLDSSETKERLALFLGVTAGALVTGGVVRYVTRSRRQEPTRVGIAPTRDGGVVTVLGRF